jgi:hypothetical protein
MQPYRFPGIRSFVAGEGLPPSFAAKITADWFVSRSADALAQAAEAAPENREAILEQHHHARAALAACLATVDAAFSEVEAHCLPSKPKSRPSRSSSSTPPTSP